MSDQPAFGRDAEWPLDKMSDSQRVCRYSRDEPCSRLPVGAQQGDGPLAAFPPQHLGRGVSDCAAPDDHPCVRKLCSRQSYR